MTAAGPTRSFGPPAPGKIITEDVPKVNTCHRDYFENYKKAYYGEEDFLVKIPETRRVLAVMDAVRKSAEKALRGQKFCGTIYTREIKRWSSVTHCIKNIKDFKGGSLR